MITIVLQRLEALTNVNSDFSILKNKQTWLVSRLNISVFLSVFVVSDATVLTAIFSFEKLCYRKFVTYVAPIFLCYKSNTT